MIDISIVFPTITLRGKWFLLMFILCLNYSPFALSQSSEEADSSFSICTEDELNNIFKNTVEYKDPPTVIDTIETNLYFGNIKISKIHFESIIDNKKENKIYAIMMHPNDGNNLAAILMLHGGTQTADDYYDLGLKFAARGYAVLIPDLPGIASPEYAYRDGKGSSGEWMSYPYGEKHFETDPTVKHCVIYEGITAAIQAFYLLKNQSFVNSQAIGIRGLSWGGYAATLVTALLGKQVKAGVSIFGSGFYDLPSYFKSIIDNMDDSSRKAWLSSLDAGRYANLMKAPFCFIAATNDTYFYPPAVMATFDQIKGNKNIIFSPNNDHDLSNLSDAEITEFSFFDNYLKKEKSSLPKIQIESVKSKSQSSIAITFQVKHHHSKIKDAVIWYSSDDSTWMKKKWHSIPCNRIDNNKYAGDLLLEQNKSLGEWYILVTDESKASNGTKIYKTTYRK